MGWDDDHTRSERLAAEAELATRAGDRPRAEELYGKAAETEARALEQVPSGKQRTLGITAVSAVALWYKSRDFTGAERLAYQYLGGLQLPSFAQLQLRELLNVIWTTQSARVDDRSDHDGG